MNANGGAGKVTKRMEPLLQDVRLSKTQMMACRHGDGKSWWLLKQASDTNMVYKFLLTDDRIYGPYIQGFTGVAGHFSIGDNSGQSAFSPDGTKYATTNYGSKRVFVADFDRCSGMLSNPKVYNVPPRFSGNPYNAADIDSSTCSLAFSPNGKYLYVGGYAHIEQLSLSRTNPGQQQWTYIGGPDTSWDAFQFYETMYSGPDGKIYIGNHNGLCGQMSVINSPDNYGAAADFCRKCLRFPPYYDPRDSQYYYNAVASPPCMPNYHLGAANPVCFPLGVKPVAGQIALQLYPNPTNGILNIQYTQAGSLELYDITNRRLKTILLPDAAAGKAIADIGGLPSGVVICRYLVDGKLSQTRKIMVLHE